MTIVSVSGITGGSVVGSVDKVVSVEGVVVSAGVIGSDSFGSIRAVLDVETAVIDVVARSSLGVEFWESSDKTGLDVETVEVEMSSIDRYPKIKTLFTPRLVV